MSSCKALLPLISYTVLCLYSAPSTDMSHELLVMLIDAVKIDWFAEKFSGLKLFLIFFVVLLFVATDQGLHLLPSFPVLLLYG